MKTFKTLLWAILILMLGFFIGSRFVIGLYKKHRPEIVNTRGSIGIGKINTLMNAINRKYVDEVDMDSIIEEAVWVAAPTNPIASSSQTTS